MNATTLTGATEVRALQAITGPWVDGNEFWVKDRREVQFPDGTHVVVFTGHWMHTDTLEIETLALPAAAEVEVS